MYTELIKIKRNQLDPLKSAFADSLWRIKVFKNLKKADYQFKIETSIFASQPHIKMERLSSGPSRALFSQFPSGDKTHNCWKNRKYPPFCEYHGFFI